MPTAFGFSESKPKARRAAWAAIHEHVSDPWNCAVRRVSWAWDVLRHMKEQDDCPLFSRCKVGRGKWSWVVCKDCLYSDDGPLAQGIAESPEACRRAAEDSIGSSVALTGNYLAEWYQRREVCIRRRERHSDSSETAKVEYVYECRLSWDDYDKERMIATPYRIVKKTKSRIFVDVLSETSCQRQPQGDWQDYDLRTFILPRKDFEEKGSAWSRRMRSYFYADPEVFKAERRVNVVPECLAKLGLDREATKDEVKASFRRLAKKAHPDAGGDPEEFKALMTWYDQALMTVA